MSIYWLCLPFLRHYEQCYSLCLKKVLLLLTDGPIAGIRLAPASRFCMSSHAFSPSLVSLLSFLHVVIFHLYWPPFIVYSVSTPSLLLAKGIFKRVLHFPNDEIRTLQTFSELPLKNSYFFTLLSWYSVLSHLPGCDNSHLAVPSVCSAVCIHLLVGPWGLLPARAALQAPSDCSTCCCLLHISCCIVQLSAVVFRNACGILLLSLWVL